MDRHDYLAAADDYTTTIESTPDLESAYESLLTNRESLFTVSDLPELSEEDKMCNKNLETSYLFKTLSDKAIQLNKQIVALVDNEVSLDDTLLKFKNTNLTITNLCILHCDSSIESLQKKYLDLTADYNIIQTNMKKEINKKREKLEAELDTVNSKLNGIRKLIQLGIEDLIKPEDVVKKMCAICFEREVNMVMIPCGHTYCDACSKYDYRAKCPQCRTTINSRVKIYFSI
jgi:hypothetical protein